MTVLPDGGSLPAAVVPGTLLAAAGFVPASRSTSWIGSGLSGHLAVPCYALTSGRSALIVDTGLAAHWSTVQPGLDHVLAGAPDRSLIMTRREPDAIGNLPGIVERFDLKAVYCGGVISPLDFFERVDTVSTSMQMQAIADVDVTWIRPGSHLVVGELCIEVLPTTLRVLPKNHLYEQQSRTLFGSDTWGIVPQAFPNTLEVVRDEVDWLSITAITRHLLHRFEWLAGADTSPMQAELGELSSRPIDRICSSYGCIIEGRRLVATVFRNTVAALKAVSQQAHVRRMKKSVRDRISTAAGVR